jgi:hypothetical protein
MSAGDQNYSRAAQFECLSDPTVPLSVWIVQKYYHRRAYPDRRVASTHNSFR